MKHDPWFKASLTLETSGRKLSFQVPHDVFSTLRIDEGTLLLLDNLPQGVPEKVLDVGCGYGALGLPVAARFPTARVLLVDRDLLAVEWSRKNALQNSLDNVTAAGSLGYRDLPESEQRYDWILCNVPARIGRPFIRELIRSGLFLLGPDGELRIVVIRDLCPTVEEIQAELRAEFGSDLCIESVAGPRHSVFAFRAPAASGQVRPGILAAPDILAVPNVSSANNALYLRDEVEIAGLRFDRPFDLGGDDPRRLSQGLPVLLDILPRQPVKTSLVFRPGYGILPIFLRKRSPSGKVTAIDRDLLATTFLRRNASKLDPDSVGTDLLEVREAAHFPAVIQKDERFDLIVGELSPSAGEQVAVAELLAVRSALRSRGQALLLMLDKIEKEWIRALSRRSDLSLNRVISRDGFTVMRLAP